MSVSQETLGCDLDQQAADGMIIWVLPGLTISTQQHCVCRGLCNADSGFHLSTPSILDLNRRPRCALALACCIS